MPVSKNRRKSKRGQRRKENQAMAASNFGDGGDQEYLYIPHQTAAPATTPPGVESHKEASTETAGTE